MALCRVFGWNSCAKKPGCRLSWAPSNCVWWIPVQKLCMMSITMRDTLLGTPASVHLHTLCWVVGDSFMPPCCVCLSWNSSWACQQVRTCSHLPPLRLTSQALNLAPLWLLSGGASQSSSGEEQRMTSSWPTASMLPPSATQSRMLSVSRTLSGWLSLVCAPTWAASHSQMRETLAAGSAHATARTMTSLGGSARAQRPSTWRCRRTASWKRTSSSSVDTTGCSVGRMALPFCLIDNYLFLLPGYTLHRVQCCY